MDQHFSKMRYESGTSQLNSYTEFISLHIDGVSYLLVVPPKSNMAGITGQDDADGAASHTSVAHEPTFFGLPIEIRQLIYDQYFTRGYPDHYSIVCIGSGVFVSCSSRATYLLRTCKQVYNEAWPFFARKVVLTTTYHDHITTSMYMPELLRLHLETLQINYNSLLAGGGSLPPIRMTFPSLTTLNIAISLGRDWDAFLTQNPPLSDIQLTDRVVSNLGLRGWLDYSGPDGRQSPLSVVIMIVIRALASQRDDYCIRCSYPERGCFGLVIGVREKQVIRHRRRRHLYEDFEFARRALKEEATFPDGTWTTSRCTSVNGHPA